MMDKSPLSPERIRTSTGRVACIAQRVVRDGFWSSRSQQELLLSVFFVVVADRHGLSYDSFAQIGALLPRSLDDDLRARTALSTQDRMAVAGPLLPVRSRPPQPVRQPAGPLHSAPHLAQADPATIRHSIRTSLGAEHD